MRLMLRLALLAWLGWGCRPAQPVGEEEAPPPNILFILTDDQGWGDLSVHGNPFLQTPALDSLALESVRFDRFYVSPVCAPTRASLLTGRYHLRTGTTWVTHRREVMRATEATLAEYLQEAGYRTGLFGKWHNGAQYPHDPAGQGFDEFFGFTAGHWNNYFDTRLLHNRDTVRTEGYITDVLTDAAANFILANRQRPWFCYLAYNAPHSPFQVPDRYYDKYRQLGLDDRTAAVYGMVENLDDNVDRLLQVLDTTRLTENTIVVFLTDNGPNGQRYNGGMKGIKGSVDEGGVRVPCFIRWPGRLPANRLISPLAAHIDLLPTLMELAGLPLNPVHPLDGRSLAPLMTAENPAWEDRSIFNIHTEKGSDMYPGAVRTSRFRLVLESDSLARLYDMLADPGQDSDIAARFPELTDSLRGVFGAWYQDVAANGLEPPPISVGYPQAPVTELPAPEGRLNGYIRFAGGYGWANDYIIDWQSPADSVVWTIFPAEEGRYEVAVEYTGSREAVGAALQVASPTDSVTGVVTAAHNPKFLPSPDRVERGEVYEKDWARLYLGPLDLRAASQPLRLSIDRNLPPGALEVKAVWLMKSSSVN